MAQDATIGFIGFGNMGEALVRGLLRAGTVTADRLLASDPRAERRRAAESQYGIRTLADNCAVAAQSQMVVLAIKPQILLRIAEEISQALDPDTLIVSIAAGMPVSAIANRLRPMARIVRVMSNTPVLVGEGATAIAGGAHATAEDLEAVKRVFDAVGMTLILEEEELIDSVTGLSGSGPAYVFLIVEALCDAGVKVGIPRYHAQSLAVQTMLGSLRLLIESGEHPGRLKDMITSPGGTAIAGLHTLEAGGLRTTLIDAVEAATRRSRELGQELQKG